MVGLETCTVPGAPLLDRVDEHQRVAPVEQVIRQMHSPDAVVHKLDVRAGEPMRDVAHHLGAEAVVPKENVADPGYQDSGRGYTSQTVTCGGSSNSAWHPGWT
jgi:hypothetical protein